MVTYGGPRPVALRPHQGPLTQPIHADVPELRLVQQMLNALRRQLVKSGDLRLIKYRTPLSKFTRFVGTS